MSHDTIEQDLRRVLAPDVPDGGACAGALYRYAAGEATPAEAAEFEAHLATCAECQEDLAAFRAEDDASATPRASTRRWLTGGLAAAAVLLVGLFLGLPGVLDTPEGTPRLRPKGLTGVTGVPADMARTTGAARLQVAVQRGEQRFVASEGQAFQTGDVLGFFYSATDPTWPVILFCDDAGEVAQVFPPGEAVMVPAGVEQPLPVSAVVEEARGCEWIVGFFARRQPSLELLSRTLREAIGGRGPNCTLPPIELEDVRVDIRLLNGPGDVP